MAGEREVKVQLSAEEYDILEQVRGEASLGEFLQMVVGSFIEENIVEDEDEEDDPMAGLSIEDHQRLADSAEADTVSLAEIKLFLDQKFARLEAERDAANGDWMKVKVGQSVLRQLDQITDDYLVKQGLGAAREIGYKLYEAMRQTAQPN